MVIGNTGCGKSTLLNSLLLGPDNLEEVTVIKEIPQDLGNGKIKTKKVKNKMIDVKQAIKDNYFIIGHSSC